jgi:hypothetical protein
MLNLELLGGEAQEEQNTNEYGETHNVTIVEEGIGMIATKERS